MADDQIDFEILDDGRAKAVTDVISPANHVTSENVLKFVAELAGIKAVRRSRTDVKKHDHVHHNKVKS